MRKVLSALTAASLLLSAGAGVLPAGAAEGEQVYTISLSSAQNEDGSWSHAALYEGEEAPEYDYVWHADPSQAHDEVKDSPAEYYTGQAPDGGDPVYIAHDIYYYPELDADGFQRENYDGEMEWVYRYTAEGYEDYIFSTLPVSGSTLPTQMMHSAGEAYENAVLHITQPGTYVLEGEWHGQIWIDLGDTDDTFTDESAKVTLILNGVDVTCTVGTGVLNIESGYEGLDTELHLTLNGGNVHILSQDDGINVNEDGVSVVTVNGGSLHIVGGAGSEGDGIDSNGFLVINGGVVISTANPAADSGLDSDMGSYINGGYVVATGSTMDWAESDSEQVTMNLQFASMQNSDEAIIVTDQEGNVIFAYDPDKDETAGSHVRSYQGAVISCPQFAVGETYRIYVGGDVEGAEVNGLYDAATVTGFSDEARMQSYTGTDVGMGRPGGGMGGWPDGQHPEGVQPGQPPEGMEPPEGTEPGTRPEWTERPEGTEPDQFPEGMEPGQRPNGGGQGETGPASTAFYMADKVNAFSGVADAAGGQTGFSDVAPGSWYEQAVAYVTEQGLMTGTGGNAFSPDGTTSRGMAAAILYRLAGSPDTEEGSFSDVAAGQWYSAGVSWAAETGVMEGYGDGTFGPEDALTREQLAALICHYVQFQGCDTTAGGTDLSAFTDGDDVSGWALPAMIWAVESGVLSGKDGGRLDPQGQVTRAETAQILTNLAQVLSVS